MPNKYEIPGILEDYENKPAFLEKTQLENSPPGLSPG